MALMQVRNLSFQEQSLSSGRLIVSLLPLLAIAAFSLLIGKLFAISPTLLTLSVGLIINLVASKSQPDRAYQFMETATVFASQTILRVGIALLGFRLSVGLLSDLGLLPIILAHVVVIATLTLGYFVGTRLGLKKDFTIISSGATAICGASAALAITSAFPQNKERESQTVLAVMVVTLMSSAAMLLYPIIARMSGFDATQAGLLFGATIHDVAQVVGAGLLFGDEAVETAAYSKMLRVILLAPVVMIVASVAHKLGSGSKPKAICNSLWCTITQFFPPTFLMLFVAFAAFNNLVELPAMAITAINIASQFALLMALTALSIRLNIQDVRKLGIAPVILISLNTFFVLIIAYSAIMFFT